MRHPDEIGLMRYLLEQEVNPPVARISLRTMVRHHRVPVKRAKAYVAKWVKKGWYEYGVTYDLGWLTEKGIEAMSEIVAKEGGTVRED